MTAKRMLFAVIVVIFAFGLCRAARFKYQEREDAIQKEAAAQMAAQGLTKDAAKAKYPTPEISSAPVACIAPGATGEVVVRGRFPAGSRFVIENDNLEVVKENLAGGEYRATVKAAAGIGPQDAAIRVFSPVSAISNYRGSVVKVGGRFVWTLDAANGWRIVARPAADACNNSEGQRYEMTFTRKGETNPFEKRNATLHHDMYSRENYRFSISQEDPAAVDGLQDFTELMKKMGDPNLTDAQREALMKNLEKIQTQMQANMEKMANPANAQKAAAEAERRRQEFGCESIALEAQAAAIKGTMRCSEKVGRQIGITGAMSMAAK